MSWRLLQTDSSINWRQDVAKMHRTYLSLRAVADVKPIAQPTTSKSAMLAVPFCRYGIISSFFKAWLDVSQADRQLDFVREKVKGPTAEAASKLNSFKDSILGSKPKVCYRLQQAAILSTCKEQLIVMYTLFALSLLLLNLAWSAHCSSLDLVAMLAVAFECMLCMLQGTGTQQGTSSGTTLVAQHWPHTMRDAPLASHYMAHAVCNASHRQPAGVMLGVHFGASIPAKPDVAATCQQPMLLLHLHCCLLSNLMTEAYIKYVMFLQSLARAQLDSTRLLSAPSILDGKDKQ